MGSCQHPLSANESSTAEVLVQRINQRHLPAPLPILAVFATHHSTLSHRVQLRVVNRWWNIGKLNEIVADRKGHHVVSQSKHLGRLVLRWILAAVHARIRVGASASGLPGVQFESA